MMTKKDVMSAVEIKKQVYLLYKESYKLNTDYLESFRVNLKLRKAHNEEVGYYPGLSAVELQFKKISPATLQTRTRRLRQISRPEKYNHHECL